MIMTTSRETAGVVAGATTVTSPVVAPGPLPVSGPVAAAQPANIAVADAASATRAVSVRSTWVLPVSGRALERLEVAAQGLVPRVGRQLGVQGGDGDAVLAHRGRAHPQLAQDPVGGA